jgi:hypothetical protein
VVANAEVANKNATSAALAATNESSPVALPRRGKTSAPATTNNVTKQAVAIVRGTATDDDDEAAWRIEVMDRGKRYILRRGSGDLRETYSGGGGKFDEYHDEARKEQYYANRETQSKHKRAAEQKRQSRHGSQRDT